MSDGTPLRAAGITGEIVRCFYRVYDALGFGFLESVYRRTLVHELTRAGTHVQVEVPVDVFYDGVEVGHFRADLVVEHAVLVELKASHALTEADRKQLHNYLRGTSLEVGLLLHFGPRPTFQRLLLTNDRKPAHKAPRPARGAVRARPCPARVRPC